MIVPKLFKQSISAVMVMLALSTSCNRKSVTVSKNADTDKEFKSVLNELITRPYYEDAQVETNTAYTYRVSAVDRFGYESNPSPDASFSLTERIAAPSGLFVRKLSTGVEISWPKSNDAKIISYNIYRKSATTKEFVKLGSVKPADMLFLDKKYLVNQLNIYAITITTKTGESEKSTEKSLFVEK